MLPVKLILLNNKTLLLDPEDFEYLFKYKWYISSHGYLVRTEWLQWKQGKKRTIYFHRLVTNAPDNLLVDHINGNTLDNRKINLRVCSAINNSRNRKMSKNNTSGFNGVTYNKEKQKWQSQIMFNKKRMNLGYFEDKSSAARAYDKRAIEYFGEFAKTNFI